MTRAEILGLVRDHLSEEQASRIATVGDAVDFVLEHAPA
jgi:hypothetical protein